MKNNKWLKIVKEENGRFWIVNKKTKDVVFVCDDKRNAEMYLEGYAAGMGVK